MNFFKKLLNSLNHISRPIFSFDAHQSAISFVLPNDEFFSFTLENYDVKTRHDPYVFEAYTFNSKDIFFEYIHLDSVCNWNGLGRSFFEDLLKKKINQNLVLKERYEIGHYEFSTYETESNGFLHLIFIWDVSKSIFLIDKKGILYKEFLSLLKSDYKYLYEDKKIYDLDIEVSLVKHNSLNQYFNASGD